MVEAAARDRVWGIGFTAEQALVNKERWGLNLLGKALERVREQMRRRVAEERQDWDVPNDVF